MRKRTLSIFLVTIIILVIVLGIGYAFGITTNLAINKPATASSSWGSTLPKMANDGNLSTTWASTYPLSAGTWYKVDLGQKYNLSQVKIIWGSQYATAYKILVSDDDKGWTTAYIVGTGASGTSTIPINIIGRYVQIIATNSSGANGANANIEMKEFEVYGDETLPPVPPTPGTDTTTTPPASTNPPFIAKDVTTDTFRSPDIKWVLDEGLMYNNKDGYFKPDQTVTRAELASALHRVYELSQHIKFSSTQ